MTSTVRIRETTHQVLRELARRKKTSMSDVLDDALEAYRRQEFFREVNESYAALQADAEGWARYQEEVESLNATAAEGLGAW